MKNPLVRLFESIGGRELRRTELERIEEIVESIQDMVDDRALDKACKVVEEIKGIEWDEKEEAYVIKMLQPDKKPKTTK